MWHLRKTIHGKFSKGRSPYILVAIHHPVNPRGVALTSNVRLEYLL
ncbi:hypothetical protein EV194_111103 [Natronoflexus pectinivorans]|uniref:Uncharacterized protein n=1 Tax=Natronoflexus pectinivorans TaxID=682526 RepID=A0A4R2GG07_9BACT|nr:hypothetical protein EV194_111103 [Natronoflexus pectinivorans]